jgi:hypothetical protein
MPLSWAGVILITIRFRRFVYQCNSYTSYRAPAIAEAGCVVSDSCRRKCATHTDAAATATIGNTRATHMAKSKRGIMPCKQQKIDKSP